MLLDDDDHRRPGGTISIVVVIAINAIAVANVAVVEQSCANSSPVRNEVIYCYVRESTFLGHFRT